MIPVFLLVIPLVSGLAAFFFKDEKTVRAWALFSSLITLTVSILGLTVFKDASYLQFTCKLDQQHQYSFSVRLDGWGRYFACLPRIVSLGVYVNMEQRYKKPNNFFALMLLMQVGLMGVFLAMDALLFYFFWELALIPAYFLCSQWGGEKRIAVTFKFFIYTFIGSILMLVGIIYIYLQTPDHSFDITSFYNSAANAGTRILVVLDDVYCIRYQNAHMASPHLAA